MSALRSTTARSRRRPSQAVRCVPLALLAWGLATGVVHGAPADPGTRPVTLVADDWCPQHCEADPQRKGYVVDIVTEALRSEGFAVDLRYVPWARAMNMVIRGDADGLLTPTVPGFPQFLYASKAVGYQQYCFYVPESSHWRYTRFSDLLGKRLAYLKDSGFGALDDYLKAHKSSITTTEMTDGRDFARRLFKFLGLQRADAVIVTTDVYAYSVAKGDISPDFKPAGCLADEKMAVGLSPAQPERSRAIGAALDQGITRLRASGRLKKILANYGLTVWPD